MSLTNLDAGPFKVGDRVTGTVDSLKGESATVIDRGRTWVRVRMDSGTDDVRYYHPADLVNLPQGDAEDTFKVGDRVTGKENSLKGQKATVVGMDRDWVKVRSDSRPRDVRRYRPSQLVHLDVMESDLSFVGAEGTDTDAKTDIRVVAIFSSLGTQKLEMVFYDAREADVWIDFLKNAPGVTTVTRDSTETFTCNNA